MDEKEEILNFWFKECKPEQWFKKNEDFDQMIKSDIADIKQCSQESGVDHILASRFLQRFVKNNTPWLHMDLSSSNKKGGLAHVPTNTTGFGVRYTVNLLLNNYIFYSKRDFNGKLPFKNGGIIDLQRNYYGFGSSLDFSKEKNQFKHKTKFGIEYLSQEDQRDRYENNFGEKGLITFSQLEFFKNFGIYLLSNLNYKKLFFQSGLRYDNQNIGTNDIGNDIHYSSINPNIGVSYLVGQKNRIFANFSTSFESPSLSELSSNPSGEEGLNKELNPSKAKNYEIGWRFFGKNIIIETTLFYINSSNELLPYELEEFPGRSFYRNAGSTNRTGVEMSYKRSWKNLNMIRSLSYAKYIFDDYIKKGEDLSGKNIPGIPSMTRNFELNYENNGWKVQFSYNNIDSSSYKLFFVSQALILFATSSNTLGLNGDFILANFTRSKNDILPPSLQSVK